jgi:wyosine [tRNA(Phe)-imidazoG37] synthetase (radical SAM superfamily)
MSLGINNIPPKICTYSCVYCQIGRSLKVTIERQSFYSPTLLFEEIKQKIEQARRHNEVIDYLTFVPDGEPTLDQNLGTLLTQLKSLGLKLAVITNASLIYLPEVREALLKANWVSVKVDTVSEKVWHKIDRPHRQLPFQQILDGLVAFAAAFNGTLVTETMLVKGINDAPEFVEETARFIARLSPRTAYLSIPTRPPAEPWVEPPNTHRLNQAFQSFTKEGLSTEFLIGYEGNAFAFTGDVEEDILSITAVHPMREDAVLAFLEKAKSDFGIIEKMVREKKLIRSEYNGHIFYLRPLRTVRE